MTGQTFSCGACGKTFALRPELIGRRVKCPACGDEFVVTLPDSPAPLPPPTESSSSSIGANAGPTDKQFRLGAAILLLLTIPGMALAIALQMIDLKGMILVALGPFAVFFSIAALIDPNIVRAAGKYGSRLPRKYKIVAGIVGVAALLASGTLSAWFYLMQTQ